MVGFRMKGIPSTNMGGIPTRTLRYGDYQRYYRYYRIEMPGGLRGGVKSSVVSLFAWYPGVYGMHFSERVNGPNLLDASCTVTSNISARSTVAAWLSDYLSLGEQSVLALPTAQGMQTVFTIDFSRAVYIEQYSIAIAHNTSGWKFYGSNDDKNWYLINDVPVYPSMGGRPGMSPAAQWYTVRTLDGQPQQKQDRAYKYWGVLFGSSSADWLAYTNGIPRDIDIYQLEFLDTPGGTDLCVGGEPGTWVNPIGAEDFTNVFDDNTATLFISSTGEGISYQFPDPVSPEALTITSGSGLYDRPMDALVMCSDDGYNWAVAKALSFPIDTWSSAAKSTEEFTI